MVGLWQRHGWVEVIFLELMVMSTPAFKESAWNGDAVNLGEFLLAQEGLLLIFMWTWKTRHSNFEGLNNLAYLILLNLNECLKITQRSKITRNTPSCFLWWVWTGRRRPWGRTGSWGPMSWYWNWLSMIETSGQDYQGWPHAFSISFKVVLVGVLLFTFYMWLSIRFFRMEKIDNNNIIQDIVFKWQNKHQQTTNSLLLKEESSIQECTRAVSWPILGSSTLDHPCVSMHDDDVCFCIIYDEHMKETS